MAENEQHRIPQGCDGRRARDVAQQGDLTEPLADNVEVEVAQVAPRRGAAGRNLRLTLGAITAFFACHIRRLSKTNGLLALSQHLQRRIMRWRDIPTMLQTVQNHRPAINSKALLEMEDPILQGRRRIRNKSESKHMRSR